MKNWTLFIKWTAILIAIPALLVGCKHDTRNYEVKVINLTQNQPFSPLAVVLHNDAFTPWAVGSSASLGLEELSESGDNSMFLIEAKRTLGRRSKINGHRRDNEVSGDGVILPGMSQTVEANVGGETVLLTSLTMLVNTNDAFAGINSIDLSDLAVGDELKRFMPVYDAGTEGNSESLGSIPGPAAGGEGFNAERDDVDYVARHPGVVTDIDGYTDSVLDQSHRFDAPVALVVVKRLE